MVIATLDGQSMQHALLLSTTPNKAELIVRNSTILQRQKAAAAQTLAGQHLGQVDPPGGK